MAQFAPCTRVVVLTVLIASLEGVSVPLSFARRESVTASKIVHAAARDVQRAVLEQPRFDRALPLELSIGFPRPTAVQIADGATRWTIRMRGGEMRVNGIEPRAGDLVLELEASQPGLVRWRALSDNSHMTHFLTWCAATVEWQAIDPQTTKVTWTLEYDRGLDPAWYSARGRVSRGHCGWLFDRHRGDPMIAATRTWSSVPLRFT